MIRKLLSLLLPVLAVSVLFAAPVSAAKCDSNLLAYPAWHNGLQCETVGSTTQVKLGELNDIWIVVLNIVQWIIITAGYVALGMIIWSGFQYMIAQGEPSKIEAAKSSLMNAIIGLVIALSAVIIIQTIQRAITGDLL